MPAIRPSAGVLATRSSVLRRARWAAMTSAPYSSKLPGSHRSSMFSRAVRRPPACRRSVASGRPASRVASTRARSSASSGRIPPLSGTRPASPSLGDGGGTRSDSISERSTSPACTASPRRHGHRVDAAGRGGLDHVLHLHGLEHDEQGPGGHLVSRRHGDPEHGAGERHPQLGQPCHRGSGTSKPTGAPQALRYETSCTGRRAPTPQVPVG